MRLTKRASFEATSLRLASGDLTHAPRLLRSAFCGELPAGFGDAGWYDGVRHAIDWFLGANDGGAEMWDRDTGGGYDGLTPDGANLNQGAESTLALIATLQHARNGSLRH